MISSVHRFPPADPSITILSVNKIAVLTVHCAQRVAEAESMAFVRNALEIDVLEFRKFVYEMVQDDGPRIQAWLAVVGNWPK